MDARMKEIEQFKTYLERQYPDRRTAIDYTSDIRQFSLSCSKPWREVSRQDIDTFVDQQRQAERSGATIKRRVSALKSFFDLEQDPGECHNLIDHPDRQSEIAQWRGDLINELTERDCGWVKDDQLYCPPDEPLVSPYKLVRWSGQAD